VHQRITLALQPFSVLVLFAALLAAGCEKIGYTRTVLPDLGPQLPMSVTLVLDPSVTSAKFTYKDNCGALGIPVFIGKKLESALTDAADQTFKTVRIPGTPSAQNKSDVTIQVMLQQQGFKMRSDNTELYDRMPTELILEIVAVYRDASDKVIREVPLKVTHRDRVFLSIDTRHCDYLLEPFAQDAAVSVATLFARASRDVLDPNSQTAGGSPPAAGSSSSLVLQTAVLDENGNGLLEGGERVRVRVDLTNSGKAPITGITVTLGGTPSFVSYFPSPTLSVDALQPGESRSVEFASTLPLSVEGRAEVTVSARAASGSSEAAAHTVTAMLRGDAGRFDPVDQIPPNSALQRPHTYVLSVGISSYRDPQIAPRKYAALDAELVAAYFQTVGGVPAPNIRLLQDWKAVRTDIEEFILEWLPKRLTSESVVVVYFSGQAAVSPNGETYLIPYDGKHNSTARLYPLKDLEAGLARLKTKQTLFIFDGGVLSIGPGGTAKNQGPRWNPGKSPVLHLIGTTGLRSGLEPAKLRHGLFTYYLLRGLKGEADTNVDGDVTLRELTMFIERTVPAAAKQDFSQEQRPLIVPPVLPSSKSAGLVLTKSAAK